MHETRPCFRPTHLVKTSGFSLKDHPQSLKKISTKDCALSAFAMFHLKYPSLLQFDKACRDPGKLQNITSMYGLRDVPCDTTMRERLDTYTIEPIQEAMHDLIGLIQRSQSLQQWDFMKTKRVGLDGTQFFSSNEVHCNHCCEKKHKNGTTTYHHHMRVGSIVSPFQKHVFPIMFELMCKMNGDAKNDCERNAVKRWLKRYRPLYPNMPTTIVEDGLASNAPHIHALKEARCHFILGAKEDDHKFLYDWFLSADAPDVSEVYRKKLAVLNDTIAL